VYGVGALNLYPVRYVSVPNVARLVRFGGFVYTPCRVVFQDAVLAALHPTGAQDGRAVNTAHDVGTSGKRMLTGEGASVSKVIYDVQMVCVTAIFH
jgi:hypothetical protein